MRKLNELLDIRYPMIQGGMAHIATGMFAAQCANAGILGVIGSGGMTPDELCTEIDICRAHTKNTFAVNLVLTHRCIEEMAEIVIEKDVKVVITGNGNALKYIPKWREKDIFVIPVIGTPGSAKYLERAGATAIIAEGSESGGHIGPMTTMTLIPQVCDMTSLPVVAAGGIADHRQFNAALALGACGVQVGTVLLVSQECPIHVNYKKRLIKADSTANVVIGQSVGDPVRVMKNSSTAEYLKRESRGATKEELNAITLGGLRRAVQNGDMESGSVMAGLVSGQLKAERSIAEIVSSICNGDG